jgi:ATP-dependent Clp protease ATP-binding subunit ClpA
VEDDEVEERPEPGLLFDEIEKAHGGVMDKFLQILEDGRLTDGKGQTVYFSQTVIIFTSNIGSDGLSAILKKPGGAGLASYEVIEKHYQDAVRKHFSQPRNVGGLGRPELYNRLGDNILVFDVLRPEFITGILRKFMTLLAVSARERLGMTLTWDESVEKRIVALMQVEGNLALGGRRIKALLESHVERPFNRWLFDTAPPAGSSAVLSVAPGPESFLMVNGDRAVKKEGP